MTTPVSFELDKLLLEKDIPMPVNPTIAEVVMWLYEKHGIWIWVEKNTNNLFTAWVKTNIPHTMSDTNSPTEAYKAAIEYTLNNLI